MFVWLVHMSMQGGVWELKGCYIVYIRKSKTSLGMFTLDYKSGWEVTFSCLPAKNTVTALYNGNLKNSCWSGHLGVQNGTHHHAELLPRAWHKNSHKGQQPLLWTDGILAEEKQGKSLIL